MPSVMCYNYNVDLKELVDLSLHGHFSNHNLYEGNIIWWAGFAQITFARLPKKAFNIQVKGEYVRKGYLELKNVWLDLNKNVRIRDIGRIFIKITT